MNTRALLALVLGLFLCKEGKAQETTILYPSADMYFGNTYATTAQNTDHLRIGGWGDRYMAFWKFDWSTLPKNVDVDFVGLHLPPDKQRNNQFTMVTSATFWLLTTPWNERTSTSRDELRGYNLGSCTLTAQEGLMIDITSLYEYWVKDSNPNHGFMLFPEQNNNKWFFFPSRESNAAERARIVVYHKPKSDIPNFKLPLPGGKEWKLTTAIGEVLPSKSHHGKNHYSIDLGRFSKTNGRVTEESNVRILAAAGGIITRCVWDEFNGYNVTIDHDGDGNTKTGIQTRYLHLAFDPTTPLPIGPGLRIGKKVNQGDYLGIMGKSQTDAIHLHFGVQYCGSGGLENEILGKVKIDGYYMKDFMVNNYYRSTNKQ